MKIIEVSTKSEIKYFHKVPHCVYKNDSNWIPHIKQEVEAVFNPIKNKYFKHGEACRFVLMDEQNNAIGRIAAFIDKKRSESFKQPTGGIGFFECINSQEAAFKLFDKSKHWLSEKGMQAMDGPINFGERDRYWGLLVEGFENRPIYANPYNPPYYQKLFKDYGFLTYFEQYMYCRNIIDDISSKYKERSERIMKDKGYTFKHLEQKKMFDYAEDFRTVYNKAWKTHSNFKVMPASQARSIMRKKKPIMDEKLIWFAYYNDEPIAFFIALPEINQIFEHINGNLNGLGKLKFLYHKWKGTCNNVFGLAFGVAPDFQKKGLEGAIIMAVKNQFENESKQYKKLIITWIGDFNPKMMKIVQNLGAENYMTLKTYRKLFDENADFERCKTI